MSMNRMERGVDRTSSLQDIIQTDDITGVTLNEREKQYCSFYPSFPDVIFHIPEYSLLIR